MKVIQINSHYSVGGPPRIMNGIYASLKREGHDCKIAAARESVVFSEDSILFEKPWEIKVNAIKSRLYDNEGFNAKCATKRLINRISDYNPDIIQIHNLHGYYINIEYLLDYLKQMGKPIVWTLHDCWPVTGHCPHFTMAKCEKYKYGCSKCPLKKEYPASVFFDNSKKNWEKKKRVFSEIPNLTIVCVSEWLKEIVKQSFLSDYPARVIYNGVNLKPFKKTDSDFRKRIDAEDKVLLLGVAMHWLPRKGLYDYIKLAGELDDSFRIVLVGLEEGEVKGLPSNIIPIGPVNSDLELARIYSACDICLNLSYEETFGLSSVESVACDTPIISYDQTAVPEVARFFNTPIVNAGDIEGIKEQVRIVLTEKKQGKYSNGWADVSIFDEEKQYEKYVMLYKELTDND